MHDSYLKTKMKFKFFPLGVIVKSLGISFNWADAFVTWMKDKYGHCDIQFLGIVPSCENK